MCVRSGRAPCTSGGNCALQKQSVDLQSFCHMWNVGIEWCLFKRNGMSTGDHLVYVALSLDICCKECNNFYIIRLVAMSSG